ncbi:ABC transporter ATP-binding protein [Paenibacillus graminis]|uniref:ABC transporter ATP-binding protein n=1 Tax=Paenibacillus graminis TaxID=189425 RepID=UPI000A770402|nr:ABC transporter ATP-binding protein [Paenibacillus graminis]
MKPAVFEARNVSKQYRSGFALKGLDMKIMEGDIYGFVGENGAGKTTLMKIIGGLVQPTGGGILLFGQQGKKELCAARRRIGFLIEMPALYPHMSAEENLTFYHHILGIRNPGRIGEVLQAVALTDAGNKKTSQYSLGMRQRLGLAVALLGSPELLVLDEPVNGLDPAGIVNIRHILERLAKEQGITILISSHILSELQLLATRYGFIHKGRLVQEISAGELLQSAQAMICIATPNAERAAELLKRKLQITDISFNTAGELQIPKASVDLELLMAVLLQEGISVEGFNLSAPNLEHYYMDLIEGVRR